MFEPENDIERALMRASAEPGARAGFARALMDVDIFLVLVPEGGPIVPDADGRATIPEGTKLNLASAGDAAEVRPAIGRAVAGDVLRGRLLDAMSLDDGPFSSTLRTGIPIVPAKRGFFNRLFRS